MVYKKIYNWSRTNSSYALVEYPKKYKEISDIIKKNNNKKSISMIASGGSYGDCFLNDNGVIIDINNLNKIIKLDKKSNTVLVQCGVKIQDLLNFLMPKGYYLNCIPGFNEATVGGCINSNVHGKDAHFKGVFGNNVVNLKAMNSQGKIMNINKSSNKFLYAIGFYGLTYVVLEATLKVNKIQSSLLQVNTIKFSNYSNLFELFKKYEKKKYIFMGAWVNHFNISGSGIFKAAKWHNQKNNNFKKINIFSSFLKKLIVNFFYPPLRIFFVNRVVIKFLNLMLFNLTKNSNKKQDFADFYFPQQKYLPEESKLYKNGKVNIQILIPEKKVLKVLSEINRLCKENKMESWWFGIKKHKKDKFILSYSLNGYDITLQWSKHYTYRRNFDFFYKSLIKLIVKNKCLIYLTQDILLNKKDFKEIFKDQLRFKRNKLKIEPRNLFKNNFYKRLFD